MPRTRRAPTDPKARYPNETMLAHVNREVARAQAAISLMPPGSVLPKVAATAPLALHVGVTPTTALYARQPHVDKPAGEKHRNRPVNLDDGRLPDHVRDGLNRVIEQIARLQGKEVPSPQFVLELQPLGQPACSPSIAGSIMPGPSSRRPNPSDAVDQFWADDEAAYPDDEYRAQLAVEQEASDRESAIDTMTTWFEENFEDPQNQTPIDSEEGGYIYIWGGPFDAADVIGTQFGDEFKQEWIEAAIEQVEMSGIHEWAPTTTGDFYDHPEKEGDFQEAVIGEDRASIARRINERLDEMQAQLDQLWAAPPPAGHNHPPDEIGLPPYAGEERRELEEAIAVTREEIACPEPDTGNLARAESTFRRISVAILKWMGRKADLAIDEGIKAGISVVKWGAVATIADGVAGDIVAFVRSLIGH